MLKSGISDQFSFDHNQFNEIRDAVDLLVEERAVFPKIKIYFPYEQ